MQAIPFGNPGGTAVGAVRPVKVDPHFKGENPLVLVCLLQTELEQLIFLLVTLHM